MPLPQVLPVQIPDHVAKPKAVCSEEQQPQRRQRQHRVVHQVLGPPLAVNGVGPGSEAAKALESESDPVTATAVVLRPSAALAGLIPVQATLAHLLAKLVGLVVPARARARAMLSQLPAALAGPRPVMGRVVISRLPAMLTEPVPARARLPWLVSRLRWPGLLAWEAEALRHWEGRTG